MMPRRRSARAARRSSVACRSMRPATIRSPSAAPGGRAAAAIVTKRPSGRSTRAIPSSIASITHGPSGVVVQA